MGEQFNNFINHNKPNLVDYNLLQKINDLYKPSYSNFFTIMPNNENKLLGGVPNNVPINIPYNMPTNMPMSNTIPVSYLNNQQMNTFQESKPVTYIQYAGNILYKYIKENLFISIIVISLILFLSWCYVEKKRHDKIQEKIIRKEYMKSLLDEELFIKEPEELNINELFKDINNDLQEQIVNTTENTIKENTSVDISTDKKNIIHTVPVNLVPTNSVSVNNTSIIHGINNTNNSNKYMDVSNFSNNSYMLL
jgi:hypothetical protein